MADGVGGSTTWTEPGYDEPPRDTAGVNHLNSDYDGPARVKAGFNDRRTSAMDSAAAAATAAYRSGPAYG